MKQIWIVHGSTGEYSDRFEWPVIAVESEDLAKKWIAALDIQYQSISQHMKDDSWGHDDEIKAIMSLDPEFSMDYTGTHYFMSRVNLTGEPPNISNVPEDG